MSDSVRFGSYVLSYATLSRVEVTEQVTPILTAVTSQVRKLRGKLRDLPFQVCPRSYARALLYKRAPRNFGRPAKIPTHLLGALLTLEGLP